MNFFKILTLTILALSASMAFGEDKPAVKSPTDILFEKVVAENTRDAIKTYDLYCTQLAEASARVAKSLEGIKADLNNPKKFTNLSIIERADMMKEIDEKIKSVNEGAVGDGIVSAKVATQWLTNGKDDVVKAIVGKWKRSDDNIFVFNLNGTGLMTGGQSDSLRWIIVEKTVKVTFDTHPGWWQEMTMVDNMTFSTVRDDGKKQAMTKEPK